jgi:hypothetical protein
MKGFAIGLIVAVVLLTVLAAGFQTEGTQAAVIGAAGFGALLIALCFYALADIRSLLKK